MDPLTNTDVFTMMKTSYKQAMEKELPSNFKEQTPLMDVDFENNALHIGEWTNRIVQNLTKKHPQLEEKEKSIVLNEEDFTKDITLGDISNLLTNRFNEVLANQKAGG